MAIEIIKRGTSPENKKYKLTCARCKTVFSFLASDAKLTTDRNESVLIINCPECGNTCGATP